MYSTSSEHTRVPWAAHSYNVAFSDEIGHFEYCNRANPQGSCVNPGVNDKKKDADDQGCFNAERIAADPDRRLHRDRQRLRRSLLPEDVAGIADGSRDGRRSQPAVDPVLESDVQRRAQLQPRRVRGGPAAHRGGRLRRHLQPRPPGPDAPTRRRDRTSIRSSAPGTTARSAASGSSAEPTSPERPTPSAATPQPSSARCCSSTTQDRASHRSTARTTSGKSCPATLPEVVTRSRRAQRSPPDTPAGHTRPLRSDQVAVPAPVATALADQRHFGRSE